MERSLASNAGAAGGVGVKRLQTLPLDEVAAKRQRQEGEVAADESQLDATIAALQDQLNSVREAFQKMQEARARTAASAMEADALAQNPFTLGSYIHERQFDAITRGNKLSSTAAVHAQEALYERPRMASLLEQTFAPALALGNTSAADAAALLTANAASLGRVGFGFSPTPAPVPVPPVPAPVPPVSAPVPAAPAPTSVLPPSKLWSPEETDTLVNIVSQALLEGKTEWQAASLASQALPGRTVSACEKRFFRPPDSVKTAIQAWKATHHASAGDASASGGVHKNQAAKQQSLPAPATPPTTQPTPSAASTSASTTSNEGKPWTEEHKATLLQQLAQFPDTPEGRDKALKKAAVLIGRNASACHRFYSRRLQKELKPQAATTTTPSLPLGKQSESTPASITAPTSAPSSVLAHPATALTAEGLWSEGPRYVILFLAVRTFRGQAPHPPDKKLVDSFGALITRMLGSAPATEVNVEGTLAKHPYWNKQLEELDQAPLAHHPVLDSNPGIQALAEFLRQALHLMALKQTVGIDALEAMVRGVVTLPSLAAVSERVGNANIILQEWVRMASTDAAR